MGMETKCMISEFCSNFSLQTVQFQINAHLTYFSNSNQNVSESESEGEQPENTAQNIESGNDMYDHSILFISFKINLKLIPILL